MLLVCVGVCAGERECVYVGERECVLERVKEREGVCVSVLCPTSMLLFVMFDIVDEG